MLHGTITVVTVFVFLITTVTQTMIGQELLIQAQLRAAADQHNGQMLAAVHGKVNVFKVFGWAVMVAQAAMMMRKHMVGYLSGDGMVIAIGLLELDVQHVSVSVVKVKINHQ